MDRTTEYSADDFEPAGKLAQDSEGVRKRFKAKFKRLAARLPFAEDLLAAYYCAFDRETPRHVQLSLLGALAYFVLPFDFVPDFLPLLGFGDDAAVLVTALRMVATNIRPDHREAARQALARGTDDLDLQASGK
jgi:uncharacterized membrane protein YkvA (DUF1232 family)